MVEMEKKLNGEDLNS